MLICDKAEIAQMLIKQLDNYGWNYDREIVLRYLDIALERIKVCREDLLAAQCADGNVQFSPYHSVSYSVFLYYLSNSLGKDGHDREAEVVYYLNKVMHANDWFYPVELPKHFWAEHPLGSVLGRAKYGDYLFVYQGTTVGGNRKERDGESGLQYPTIGENVVLYANSTVLGDTKIGNNVIVSANTYLINEDIPDNCIVFGQSPNIVIKKKSEAEIWKMMEHIWKK